MVSLAIEGNSLKWEQWPSHRDLQAIFACSLIAHHIPGSSFLSCSKLPMVPRKQRVDSQLCAFGSACCLYLECPSLLLFYDSLFLAFPDLPNHHLSNRMCPFSAFPEDPWFFCITDPQTFFRKQPDTKYLRLDGLLLQLLSSAAVAGKEP